MGNHHVRFGGRPSGKGPAALAPRRSAEPTRRYRAGGFEALCPSLRQPGTRIDTQVFDLAAALKQENPGRTVAQISRILRSSTGWSPSETTLLRHFHRLDLMVPVGAGPAVFGRFEAADCNERWVGDALHGPKVAGRKTCLFAFLDDHSRLAVGYRFGFAEDTVRLAAALQPALGSRGVPAAVYVDNGSAFVDNWLLRACAVLGIRLLHSRPGKPQGRGKVERWFRTVRDQFLVEIEDSTAQDVHDAMMTPAQALLELNSLFTAWVEANYHYQEHSETRQTPLQRWNDGWQRAGRSPAMPSPDDLTEAFLWSEQRRVTKTATVSLHGNTYEVDQALVGRTVQLLFSPFNLEHIQVRYDDRDHGLAVPHRISRHTHPKARPETTDTPPARTGIDYLALVAQDHQQQVAADQKINYHALYPGELPGQLSIDDALADITADHSQPTQGDARPGVAG